MIAQIDCEQLRTWDACYYTDGSGTRDAVDARMREWMGGESATPLEVLDLDAVSVEDRLWVALQPDVLSERYQRHLACDFAEHTLHLFEREYPDDERPREAIAVARRYADGGATQQDLDAARNAARAAARNAARAAVWNVWDVWDAWDANAAANAAAEAAARAAAEAAKNTAWAAWAAEQAWQLERCRHWLRVQASGEER